MSGTKHAKGSLAGDAEAYMRGLTAARTIAADSTRGDPDASTRAAGGLPSTRPLMRWSLRAWARGCTR